jgi:hypothetical protein
MLGVQQGVEQGNEKLLSQTKISTLGLIIGQLKVYVDI